MGNTATIPQEEDSEGLPPDLFSLSDRQLTVLWEHRPLTIPEVQQAARSVLASATTTSKGGFYGKEEETAESALAVRLCRMLPDLSKIRFQLVRGKIKEDTFWESVMALLKERLVEYNAAYDDNDTETEEEEEETIEFVKPNGKKETTTNGKKKETLKNGKSTTNGKSSEADLMRQKLRAKDAQIAKLQQELQELKKGLSTTPAKKKSKTTTHKGTWKIDKDAQEFLKYPDELKESLRKEKQRRLQTVRDEMKFILDSDDVQDSNGTWSCCGGTNYNAPCKK